MSGQPFQNGYQHQDQYGLQYNMGPEYPMPYNPSGQPLFYFLQGDNLQQGTPNHVTTQARMGTPQKNFLEERFAANPKPSTEEKAQFAQMWGLSLAKINNWFQNRRAAQKRSDKEASAASAASNDNDNSDEADDNSNMSGDEGSANSSIHIKTSPDSTCHTGGNTPVPLSVATFTSFSSASSSSAASPTSVGPPMGQMSLSNIPVRGMTNSSKPRKQRPTALNLTHSNRAPNLAVQSPGSIPASPLRPSSSRKASTPGLGPNSQGVQKQRSWKLEPRASITLPQNGDFSGLSDQYEIKLPTGITDAAIPSTYMPAHLPTPPLATDTSLLSFGHYQAPESPVTPMINQNMLLRRPSNSGPLVSSAASHFVFGNETPPQTAPPTQTSFSEVDLTEPHPNKQRDFEFLNHHDHERSNRDMDFTTSGTDSREITPMEQMQNAHLLQYPLTGSFDMFTPTNGKQSNLDSFMSPANFDFDNNVHAEWENIPPVTLQHDSNIMVTTNMSTNTIPAASGYNQSRNTVWQG